MVHVLVLVVHVLVLTLVQLLNSPHALLPGLSACPMHLRQDLSLAIYNPSCISDSCGLMWWKGDPGWFCKRLLAGIGR